MAAKKKARKGLSLEEKRSKMSEIFFETEDVWQMKDLEKMGPKKKGVISQSVKEVVMSLVYDDLVQTDKIGQSTYFWAFPSQAANTRKTKLSKLKADLEKGKVDLEQLKKAIKKEEAERKESAERTRNLAELADLQASCSKAQGHVSDLQGTDPELMHAMEKDSVEAKDAANRWTDNVFTVRSYVVNKYGLMASDFDKNFEIPSDFDYLE